MRLSAKGEAMSEQLRPRYADDSLDKIPPLRQSNPYLQSQVMSSLTQPRPRGFNGNGVAGSRPAISEDLAAENVALKTRVSELELVNDLLRSRVTQLEYSESNIRESELILRRKLTELEDRNKKLSRKIKTISTDESGLKAVSDNSDDGPSDGQDSGPQAKRLKVSGIL